LPLLHPEDACTTWRVVDSDGTLVAVLPRRCDAERAFGHASIMGGFLHPGGRHLLLEVHGEHVGMITRQDLVLVTLPARP
jgi:hypothetical protein